MQAVLIEAELQLAATMANLAAKSKILRPDPTDLVSS
jgi:hypothetical protein